MPIDTSVTVHATQTWPGGRSGLVLQDEAANLASSAYRSNQRYRGGTRFESTAAHHRNEFSQATTTVDASAGSMSARIGGAARNGVSALASEPSAAVWTFVAGSAPAIGTCAGWLREHEGWKPSCRQGNP